MVICHVCLYNLDKNIAVNRRMCLLSDDVFIDSDAALVACSATRLVASTAFSSHFDIFLLRLKLYKYW
jgi:hypothetical protein